MSNVMLNELDKELEARSLNFTRYADDCVIFVKSEASAKRVMANITAWIEKKLGLKVNATKTQIVNPSKLKYLGFGFFHDFRSKEWKCRPHEDSVAKFKAKLKALTGRNQPGKVTEKIKSINEVLIGKDRARITAYCGNRYQWIATKTCVVRALSKQLFARAGLISCLDYYQERHALKLC